MGVKAHEIDRCKLWYSGSTRARNRVGILAENELIDQVVEVKRTSDHIMSIKLEVGVEVLNVICVYSPQVGWRMTLRESFGRSWRKSCRVYLTVRNSS